ncbi:MAG: hypothetical protein AB7F86_04725 [Bdellovibrionales bacterium]
MKLVGFLGALVAGAALSTAAYAGGYGYTYRQAVPPPVIVQGCGTSCGQVYEQPCGGCGQVYEQPCGGCGQVYEQPCQYSNPCNGGYAQPPAVIVPPQQYGYGAYGYGQVCRIVIIPTVNQWGRPVGPAQYMIVVPSQPNANRRVYARDIRRAQQDYVAAGLCTSFTR